MDFKEVVNAIITGELDEHLDTIKHQIRTREKNLAGDLFHRLKVGDKVRFNSLTRPKSHIGTEGVIVKKNRTKVVVKVQHESDPFPREWNTPPSLLEMVG